LAGGKQTFHWYLPLVVYRRLIFERISSSVASPSFPRRQPSPMKTRAHCSEFARKNRENESEARFTRVFISEILRGTNSFEPFQLALFPQTDRTFNSFSPFLRIAAITAARSRISDNVGRGIREPSAMPNPSNVRTKEHRSRNENPAVRRKDRWTISAINFLQPRKKA